MIKCDCGYEYDRYSYGANSSYPEVRKHQTALAKPGKYGKYWKELLTSDSELKVNARLKIYQCPNCHKIYDEFCLDLYKTKHDDRYFYTPTEEETLYHYKHICPECKKKMELIPLSEKEYKDFFNQKEEFVICPKCGNIAIVKFCGHTF